MVAILKGKCAHQEMLIVQLRREHKHFIAKNIRNNMLIHGLEDIKRESQSDLCSNVELVMLNKLGFDQDTTNNMFTHKVHRMGEFSTARPRTIVIMFLSTSDKDYMMDTHKKLSGTQISFSGQYPPEMSVKKLSLKKTR